MARARWDRRTHPPTKVYSYRKPKKDKSDAEK